MHNRPARTNPVSGWKPWPRNLPLNFGKRRTSVSRETSACNSWGIINLSHEMPLADIIFPTLMTHGALWLVLLAPVIFVEARVLSRSMRWSYQLALRKSAYANLISTVVGMPLAHLVGYMFGLIVFFYGHLLGPHFTDAIGRYGGAVMASGYLGYDITPTGVCFTILLVPLYWYLSSLIEYWVIRRSIPEEEKGQLKKTSFRMNAISYLGLTAVLGLFALALLLR